MLIEVSCLSRVIVAFTARVSIDVIHLPFLLFFSSIHYGTGN